ncbi:MAG: hypothetical protein Q9M48_06625, partial [Rhodobacterales bacterium]|nr:hypothetical protein [Rhodobacterales bacterium]
STGKINNVTRFHGGVSFFGWDAVVQQQFNQIRRQPSNPRNTRFSHNSWIKDAFKAANFYG